MKDEEFVKLMSLPVFDPARPKLRDVVPFSAAILKQRSRKFTSPAMAFAGPRTGERLGPLLTYAQWLARISKPGGRGAY